MGTEFYWFYDVILIGIVCALVFACYKRGFVSSLAGLVAFVLAFVLALTLSPPLADMAYQSLIRKNVTDYLDERLGEHANVFAGFSEINTAEITVDGQKVSSIDIPFDQSGKTVLELKNVDISKTGIENIDLSPIGVELNLEEQESLNLGKIIITDYDKYELSDLIFARALVTIYNDSNDNVVTALSGALDDFSEHFSIITGFINPGADSNYVNHALIILINSEHDSLSEAVADGVVKPSVMNPLNLIIFFSLFLLFKLTFGVLARSLRAVNRIPILGKLNMLLGVVAGLLQAFIVLFLLAAFLHIITSITGNTVIFINDTTINNSVLFKYIYNFDFLNLSESVL
ncbi:MAG: CvpA family protein [Oscillospiraceae bacterium]|nr:CvpA family protein [Oscillospiraceae bacterium]